ncbi:MAG: hypothetical protein WCT19_02510 [Candidatus Paceibacterota bacterium]
MSTQNESLTSTINRVKTLFAELDALCATMISKTAEPKEKIGRLEDDFEQRIEELEKEHKKQVAAVNKEIRSKLNRLEKKVHQAETDFETSREPISQELNSYRGKFEFRQILETLLPEDIRPTVIEVDGLQKEKLLLIQLKITPKVGVVVWDKEGHSTKHSLRAGRDPIAQQRHLVCFCGNGCMTDEVRQQHMDTLSRICNKNGIKVVFGRKVWHEQSGVQFRDGEDFDAVVLNYCSKNAFERMELYLKV